jgi:hypothetical protein
MFSFLFQNKQKQPAFLYNNHIPQWKLISIQPLKQKEPTLLFKREFFDMEHKDPFDYHDWSFSNTTYPLEPFRKVPNVNVYMYVIPLGFFLLSHFVSKNK